MAFDFILLARILLLFQVTRAEVKIAVLMAENNIGNIPLVFSNHLSRMLPKLFPDSKIAQKYSAAATKTTCPGGVLRCNVSDGDVRSPFLGLKFAI